LERDNIDNLEEMFADDFGEHVVPFGTRTEGLEALRKRLVVHRETFPDWKEVVNLIVVEGDYEDFQFTSRGTDLGSFMDHPVTGKKIPISDVTILRMVDHKNAEQ
jgi:predicted ester cyclase